MSILNSLLEFIGKKLKGTEQKILLWSNPNLTAVFNATTIPIENMSQYDGFEIVARMSNATTAQNAFQYVNIDDSDGALPLNFVYGDKGSIEGYYRPTSINFSKNNIVFNNAFHCTVNSDFADNKYVVPISIYGIKKI